MQGGAQRGNRIFCDDIAWRVKQSAQIRVQSIGEKKQPLQQTPAPGGWWLQSLVGIGQMQKNRSGFKQRLVLRGVHQNRQKALGVEAQKRFAALRALRAIDFQRFVGQGQFFENHAHHDVGAVGGIKQGVGHTDSSLGPRARMRGVIGLGQVLKIEAGVNLRGADIGVAE